MNRVSTRFRKNKEWRELESIDKRRLISVTRKPSFYSIIHLCWNSALNAPVSKEIYTVRGIQAREEYGRIMREQVKRNLSIALKFRTNSLVRSQFMPIFSRKTFVVTKIKIRNKFDF